MSDGTDRPDWIGYDVTTGELRGYPNVSDSSILLNLKFTAYDTKNGYYTYHKTMLVNVVPRPVVVYTVITTGKDRLFSYYFGDLVKDIDGDHLNFYLLNPADRTEL